jgi:hypothetical protein
MDRLKLIKMQIFYFKTSKFSAEAFYKDGRMIITKNSTANTNILSSCPVTINNIRQQLIESGILKEIAGKLIFTDNYSCSSPSQASAIINGSSSNGMLSWKDINGKTLQWHLKQKE